MTEGEPSMNHSIRKIHAAAVRILKEVGIRLPHPEVLEILRQQGMRISGDRVFFEETQIMDWVQKAPAEFTLYARNPRHDMVIGGGHAGCAPGFGWPTTLGAGGARREGLGKGYFPFSKLVHQSPGFKINGGILVQPNDVDPATSHLVMLYAAVLASDKCLMGVPGHAAQINATMEMLALLYGGMDAFTARPRVLTMISTISPLLIDEMALDSVLACARHNQPMIISPAPAAGTTGPIDLAGNVALATAEALACITVAQMVREGVPVVFGLQSYGADLRTGDISIGSPAYALQAGCCARLARHYGLPSRAGGATTDARSVNVQSGYESMLAISTAFENRINLMVHSAGILDRFAGMSYEQFMVDLELIRMVRFYRRGIVIESDADLAVDLIGKVGPGGQFLTQMDTMKKCRTHSWVPAFSGNPSGEKKPPGDQVLGEIRRRMNDTLETYQQPPLPDDALREIDRFLTGQAGVAPETLSAVKTGIAA